jgi:hypothetical protein
MRNLRPRPRHFTEPLQLHPKPNQITTKTKLTMDKSINIDNISIDIIVDDYSESPRMDENQTKFVMFHKRYSLPNETPISNFEEFYDTWLEMENDLESKFKNVHPVYMYEHGGIALSLSSFADSWDSGQIGFIYSDIESKEDAYLIAKAELQVFNHWLDGSTYGYRVTDTESGDEESQWGFYGYDHSNNGLLECLEDTLKHSFNLSPEQITEVTDQIN